MPDIDRKASHSSPCIRNDESAQAAHVTAKSLVGIKKITMKRDIEMMTWSVGKRGRLWIPDRVGGLVVSDRRHIQNRCKGGVIASMTTN
ncbi:hypothetical protein Y032_0152g2848 [Ancylostoma ceylanicum]|uniref:Uncharacterized protein n=1 Tax=Ancylostoma ceylanicum TaxID=53326 RepID=A0A016T0E3_9BILA|nr:hypothetical protein Y032_0152g2848 [Ancylostoma ceylanicum]